MTTDNTKRSFDFKRTDHYLCDPIAELCIVGGTDALPLEQRGALDTADDPTHPLHDPRIYIDLLEPFVRNIDAHGVTVPIVIVKLDDLAMVVDGRQRVRAARVVNRRREARGEPLIKVPCVIKRVRDRVALLGSMIGLNECRMEDDFATKLDKLRRVMDVGVTDPEELGTMFGVSGAVIESWLRFDDLAVARVQEAVAQGKLALRAGIEIARLREPAQQEAALDAVLADDGSSSTRKSTVRRAREAAKRITKPDAHDGVSDKRTQRKLLALTKAKDHPKGTSKETFAWWSGVEAALHLIVGGDERPDERLLALLGAARVTKED